MSETKNKAAVALGRLGGSKTSAFKSAASIANGKLGGRPRLCAVCGLEIQRIADAWHHVAPQSQHDLHAAEYCVRRRASKPIVAVENNSK